MNVSAPFIARPIATTLLTVAIGLAGAVAYRFLPVSPLPEVEFPTIQVSAGLPGASPDTMASAVATPLERQFGRIAGLTEMTSTSQLGSTQVVLQFDLSRDIDGAARDVQAAINAARSQLPANLPNNPSYRKVNPADAPVMMLALTSELATRAQMYDIASSILQQRIAQVDGVGQVFVGGGALPAVRVEVNPMALSARGLSFENLRAFLGSANANRPKGQLVAGAGAWNITSTDQLYTAADYRPLVINYENGAAVRLEDVADVVDSVEDVRTSGSANGKPAVLLIVSRQPGANIISVVDGIRTLMPALQASIPPTVTLSVLSDRTTTIRASVHDIQIAVLISIALVILVVFAFLRSVRHTFIPAVVVPISLIGTLAVMYLCGYSLDNLSLMALTIATGFVVDDAIVVIENITRHLDAGLSPLAAAIAGASEIGFTVASISLSLVAVFIPILLMSGIVGRLFREFAVTLSIAIVVSMIVSLTTTPMMCARLLRSPLPASGETPARPAAGFDWVLAQYERSLAVVLRHQGATLIVTLLTMVATGYLYVRIPKGFFPQQDTGALTGSIQADEDTSFQAMQQRVAAFASVVRQDPAVATVLAYVGGGSQNSARMFVNLKPRGQRDADAGAVIDRLRGRLRSVPGAVLYLQAAQDLRVGGRASQAQYQYTIQSEDVAALSVWTPKLYARLKTLPQLTDVNSDLLTRGLQASLTIDRATASRFGLTPQAIDNTLYDAFGQRQVSTMYTRLNQYHVVMEAAPAFWQSPDALRDIYLPASSAGGEVPLAAVARYVPSTAPLAVNHQAQFPSVTISFNLASGVALGQAVAAIGAAERELGLPSSIRGNFQGTAQAYQQSLASQPWLIAAALAAVYVVLGVLYESYIHPITILSTLPSAGVGALLALMATRTELTIIALVGIVLLIGIVKKNAILMIDFALDAERTEGRSPQDAIFQACVLRFRPILMTTMAALFGALPLAIGFGTGAELRRPLGIAIVGGLAFSQVLTLYTTPVVYLFLDRLNNRRGGKGRSRPTHPTTNPTITMTLALVVLALGSSACEVGPEYKRPPATVPAAFKELPSNDRAVESQWHEAQPSDDVIRAKWWEAFQDPLLNGLEDQVAVSNQTVAESEARLRGARAAIRDARAGLFPTVTAGAAIEGSRSSATRGSVPVASGNNVDYQLPVDVSYEADLWGRVRRNIEANVASAQATSADVQTALLSSHAEVALDYFELRGLDAEIALLQTTVESYERAVQLTKARYGQGVASGVDVAQAETQLDTTRVQLTDLGIARAQFEHAIATLIGRPPADLTIAPSAAVPPLPSIPVTLPSQLVERRPDVAAAERRVAAANASVGAARAAFFPTLALAASGGFQSSTLANLLTLPSRFWAIGPSIVQTIFDGGHRRAMSEEAVANYDGAVATYRQSVLTAFQDVEDSLAASRVLADEARGADAAVASAERSLQLANNRYVAGVTTYLEVITAQAADLSNRITAANVETRRLTASVQLIKALGGGWTTADLAARP